jgi:hypothetical protein
MRDLSTFLIAKTFFEHAAAAAQAGDNTSDPSPVVSFKDPKFWAFLFDWQFYVLMVLAFSFPIAHYLQPYIGEDNAALFRMVSQVRAWFDCFELTESFLTLKSLQSLETRTVYKVVALLIMLRTLRS